MQHRTNCPADSSEEYYKRNLIIPFLDHFLAEFNERFSNNSKRAALILHLIPEVICSKGGIDMQALKEVVELYSDDLPSPLSVNAEVHMWLVKWLGKERVDVPNTAIEALKEADLSFFPNIHTLLRIFCTMAVTSSECERSISGLRRLKTFLRTSMGEERMNGLLLLHIHRNMKIDIEEIVTEFARRNPRRMKLLDILED